MSALALLHAKRVLRRERNASTSPVVVETDAGPCFVKLRGAAQGTLSLVAEIIVAELAEAIGLSVPARSLVVLDPATPSDDRNDELAQLLDFSRGVNLGFRYLADARNLRSDEAELIDAKTAAKIVWLDAWVMNPDRTARNTNIMWWQKAPWLIDHGVALGFHHDWSRVDEQTARRPYAWDKHLLFKRADTMEFPLLSAETTRPMIEHAVAMVTDDFLMPHLGETTLARRRAAYTAVLWKRVSSTALTNVRPTPPDPT